MRKRTEPEDLLLLENQLCFLVYRLHRDITDLYRPALERLALTYPQYLVMLVLWETPVLSVGQLGERLRLDSGTLSPLLKRLESAGLVTRTRSSTDERVVELSLTAAGRALRAKARDVPGEIGGCLVDSAADYWSTRTMLTDLIERVETACAVRSRPVPATRSAHR